MKKMNVSNVCVLSIFLLCHYLFIVTLHHGNDVYNDKWGVNMTYIHIFQGANLCVPSHNIYLFGGGGVWLGLARLNTYEKSNTCW